jgi:hypothetical protein
MNKGEMEKCGNLMHSILQGVTSASIKPALVNKYIELETKQSLKEYLCLAGLTLTRETLG